ncbi:MAG: hypothetical protein UW69_C0086G0007 [Microgenomates group bacterium GW2011_GWA2_44_7]|nr:MAG: hypothetical protein UW69_C0086G0007 [Microgenomates group bacterium GW2011_GWA2_44_7]KKT78444.1 MAG: hypothetical protein UW73_C0003G0092 [Microgenomates group bacterium GW2011_GWB1_44_8]
MAAGALAVLTIVWFVFRPDWQNLFFLLAMVGCFGGHFFMGHREQGDHKNCPPKVNDKNG